MCVYVCVRAILYICKCMCVFTIAYLLSPHPTPPYNVTPPTPPSHVTQQRTSRTYTSVAARAAPTELSHHNNPANLSSL